MLPQVMWPVLAAMPAPTDNREDSDRRNLDFPGEQPSDKDLNDWLDAVLPIVRQTYGAVLNGDTPHCEKIAPHFCPGRSNGSLGLNAKGPLGRPGAPRVGTLPG